MIPEGRVIFKNVHVSRRGGKTMKKLAIIVLGIMLLSAASAGVASAQPSPNTANKATLTPFSAEMNFMSQAGYTRYLNHVQTGEWTAFGL
jgi:hypothetical protein